jgi:cytochrome c556
VRKVDAVLLLAIPAFMISVVSQSACTKQETAPAARTAAAAPPAAGTPVATVKQIMKGIVDPSSAAIWDSVGTESGKNGLVEKAPKTDEEWAKVENSALLLAEVANLLRMPGRHMANPEEADKKSVADAPELTPAQIEELVNKDRATWDQKAEALQQTAVKAAAAARAHDKDGVLNVGEEIDTACENCHKIYWYPEEPQVKSS